MTVRRLGGRGLEVSSVGWAPALPSFGAGPGGAEADLATVVARAVELGATFFDLPPDAATGGAWPLGARREEVALAAAVPTAGPGPGAVTAATRHLLRELGTDHLDLLWLDLGAGGAPAELVGDATSLVEGGDVRFLGVAGGTAAQLREAHAEHPVTAVRVVFSLFERSRAEGLLPTCRELGVGVVAASPLAGGLLAGVEVGSARPDDPRYAPGNLEHNVDLVRGLGHLAGRWGCSVGQLALAWLLHTGPDVVPVPATGVPAHLEENLAAAAVSLSPDDRTRLEALVSEAGVAGA